MMTWLFEVRGTHTHVRVILNGALCGSLIFRNEEFAVLRERYEGSGDITQPRQVGIEFRALGTHREQ